MFSMNDIMISMKSKGGEPMTGAMRDDIREVALELNDIYKVSPESYYYIKGFIHCLIHKAEISNSEVKRHIVSAGNLTHDAPTNLTNTDGETDPAGKGGR